MILQPRRARALLYLLGSFLLLLAGCGKKTPPSDDASFLRNGRLALNQGQVTRAVALLKAAVALDPKGAEPRRQLARAHLAANQMKEAERCLRQGLLWRDGDSGLWFDLGRLLARTGKHEEATRALEKAIHLDPKEVDAVLALGEIYEQHGRGTAARSLYRASLQKARFSGRLRLHRRLARLAHRDERYDEAIDELKRALALSEADGKGLGIGQGDRIRGELTADLGNVFRRAGRPAEARETLVKAVHLRPTDGQTHLRLGLVVAELEDHREATGILAKAARLLPGRPEPLAALAKCHMALGNHEAAFKAGIEALALDPTSHQIQWLMVPLYIERGLMGPAEELLTPLVGVRGHDPMYWKLTARVAEARAQHSIAREAWAKALTLRPRDPALRRNLAFAARRSGDYVSALRHLEQILAKNPNDYDALVHLGIALELTGKRRKARGALERARQSQAQRHEAHVYLAWLALRQRQTVLALDAAQKADKLARGRSPHALDVLSKALASLGRAKEAVAALDRALALPLDEADRRYLTKEREILVSPPSGETSLPPPP